ncbi:YczI family protein [Priestia koreensis]|uniref:DUF3953 domain-containing protein n=1 Tax=Priestia koreensis TaxID=284581 RepID=A0A0M0KTD0_9BACI|nr:YczI family protein [Priestia koreensis]KOO41872.1 hypothetical protein AMD01_18955 [Priestia koreensis]
MLKIFQIVLSIMVVSLATYGLITEDFRFQSYMFLSLSLVMLVIGVREFKKGKKSIGWLNIVAFVFILFVSIKIF